MKTFNPLVIAALLLLCLPLGADAEPTVSVTKEYYFVDGRTAQEIRNDLNAKTPVRQNGRKYDAHTKWNVDWHFWWRKKPGSCEISKVTTEVAVKYTLPELRDNYSIQNDLKEKWESYNRALVRHEEGHKDLGVNAARAIENGIWSLDPRHTCEQLEVDSNGIGHAIIEEYRILETKYDRETNHGMSEGAIFP
jgi:predicted secreted Zn-dependent protease